MSNKSYWLHLMLIFFWVNLFFVSEASAQENVTLNSGESIEVKGSSEVFVDGSHNFALYNENKAESYGSRYGDYTYQVKETNYIIIENSGENKLSVSLSETSFKKINEPALKKVIVEEGENWEYGGDSDFIIPNYYQYADYRESGSAYQYDQSSYNSRIVKLAAEVKNRIITFKKDQQVYGAYRTFKVPNEINEPAIKKVAVKEGESWEYFGDSNFVIPNYYQYADYRESGSAYQYDNQSYHTQMTKLSSEVKNRIITFTKDQEVYGAHRTFKVPEKINEPAIKTVAVEEGESWEYFGDSNFVVPNYYQYADYRESGSAYQYDNESYYNQMIKLSSEVKRRIITFTKDQTVYGAYRTFKVPEKINEPAIKTVNVNEGESWEYFGDSNFVVPNYYQYADYRESGSAYQYDNESYYSQMIKLSSEVKRRIITFTKDQSVYGAYRTFKIPGQVIESALDKLTLKPGEKFSSGIQGISFTVPQQHNYWLYNGDKEEKYRANKYGQNYSVPMDKKIVIENTLDKEQIIYGPYERFPEIRTSTPIPGTGDPAEPKPEPEPSKGEANYSGKTFGKLDIKGDFNSSFSGIDGKATINDFLAFDGNMQFDIANMAITGEGKFYIPMDKKLYYSGEMLLYSGTFSIDAQTLKLNMLKGKSYLTYEKIPLEISNVSILEDGLSMSGTFTFNKLLKTEDKNSTLNIDELSLTSSKGLQFKGKWTIPEFKKGIIEIEEPYIEIDTQQKIVGGGGSVGKIGSLIKANKIASIDASFQIANGRLNEIGLKAELPKPLPIGQSGFGFSAFGGGLNNIQKLNPDNGVTVYALTDISDMFSPEFDGNRLIQANDLKMQVSSMHAKGSGELNLYAYKLADGQTEFHVKKGFSSSGTLDVASVLVGESDFRKPIKQPFTGYGKVSLRVPKDIWLIGGLEFGNTSIDIGTQKIKASVRKWGVDVGVVFDFEKGKLYAANEGEGYPVLQQEEDVNILYGTNMKSKGTYESGETISALGEQGTAVVVNLKGEEASLFEISSENLADQFTILKPDGTKYPLTFTGEEANASVDQGNGKLYFTVVNPGDGAWTIISEGSTEPFKVQPFSIKMDPVLQSVKAEKLLDNKVSVVWNAAPMEDVKISLYATEEKGSNTGYLLADNLAAAGETNLSLPEELASGDYYIYAKAEREGNGSDWMYASEIISYTDKLSPKVPENVQVKDVANGSFTVSWKDAKNEHVTGYLIAEQKDGQIDYETSVYVEKGDMQTRIDHWQQKQFHNVVVLAVLSKDEEGEEFIHYSAASEAAGFYLAEPAPPTVNTELTTEGKILNKTVHEEETYYFTNKETIQLKGMAEGAVSTAVYVNEQEVQSATTEQINASLLLQPGLNEIKVISKNQQGDEAFVLYNVYLDSTSPLLQVEELTTTKSGSETSIVVKGKTEPGVNLTVNGVEVKTDEEGNFLHQVAAANKTENIIAAVSDLAGNQEKYTAAVTIDELAEQPKEPEEPSEPETPAKKYKEIESKTNVISTKEWKVNFNKPLDSDTIHNESVYVRDAKGQAVSVSLSLTEDKKAILIAPPKDGYESGGTYTLYIEEKVSSGKDQLKEPVKMTFTIN